MADEFTREEILEVIRGARAYNSSFSEEDLETLAKLEKRVADSGFLKAVNALLKLEEEKGVSLKDVREEYEEQVRQNKEMDKELKAKQRKLDILEERSRKEKEEYQQTAEAKEQANRELEEIRSQRENEAKQLSDLREEEKKEKARIDDEVGEYRWNAGVTKQETVIAGRIKALVTEAGFTLDVVLGIAREFAGYADAAKRLAEALRQEGKLTKHLANLDDKVRSRNDQLHHLEQSVSNLQKDEEQRRVLLSQLDEEIANRKEIVDFYYCYVSLRPLMDYLGKAEVVTFHHCRLCGARFWIIRPGDTRLTALKCPWCGLAMTGPDKNAYAAVSLPPGSAVKLFP
ncbi:MAG: hypothetical protein ACLFPU_11115 [Dehalococcoidia bacterium]